MVTDRQDDAAPAGARARPRGGRFGHFAPSIRPRRFSRLHSPLVTLLKFVLPLTAIALVGALVIWPRLQGRPPESASIAPASGSDGGVRMLNPRFASRDQLGRPYSVEAASAQQSPEAKNTYDLDQPSGEITTSDGAWIALLAKAGEYDEDANRLVLRGDVQLHRDDGTEFVTESATIDLATSDAWGDEAVHAQGPFGDLEARGFRIRDGGNRIVFTGPASLLLRDKAGAEP